MKTIFPRHLQNYTMDSYILQRSYASHSCYMYKAEKTNSGNKMLLGQIKAIIYFLSYSHLPGGIFLIQHYGTQTKFFNPILSCTQITFIFFLCSSCETCGRRNFLPTLETDIKHQTQ